MWRLPNLSTVVLTARPHDGVREYIYVLSDSLENRLAVASWGDWQI
jgi:hypothetical protein